jgi:hypothetical protein
MTKVDTEEEISDAIPTRSETSPRSADRGPSFVPLGHAVSAVVLRVRNSRLRIHVLAPAREGEDRDQP